MLSTSEAELTAPEIGVVGDRRGEHRAPGPRSRWQLRRLSTVMWFGLSLPVLLLAGVLAGIGAPLVASALGVLGASLFGWSILVALYRASADTVSLVGLSAEPPMGGRVQTAARVLGNLLMAAFGMFVAYLATFGFSRGRQLRHFGRVLLPGLHANSEWATSDLALTAPECIPAGVADQWRENGKTEHASVAAFARLTLDLMALGAPPSLIAAANQDALDEIRHAELCFSIARALDGEAVSPAPFPEAQSAATLPRSRTLALAKLAVDSLVDGALHEGVSARVIAKLAQRAEPPALRTALKGIAADEGRHAAHGWAVVSWCLEEGGRPVAEALRGALRTVPREMRSERPEAARSGDWECWGIHGHMLEAEEYRATLAHLTDRVVRHLDRTTKAA
jgi:hypothetical protein